MYWGRIQKLLWGLVITVLVALAMAFAFRQAIGKWVLSEVQARAQAHNGIHIRFDHFEVEGISGATFSKLVVAVPGRDTLLKADTLTAHFRLLPLLVGNIRLDDLYLHNAEVNLNTCEGETNLRAASGKTSIAPASNKQVNFSGIISRFYNQYLARLPRRMEAHGLVLKIIGRNADMRYILPLLAWNDQNVRANISVGSKEWFITGKRNTDKHLLDVQVATPADALFPLPPVEDRLNLQVGFATIGLQVASLEVSSGEATLQASVQARRFWVNQPKLCREPILLDSLQGDFSVFADAQTLRLDSTTRGRINAIAFKPYAQIRLAADTTIALHCTIDTMGAQQFFDALPPTVFASVRGAQVQGRLAYRMHMLYKSTMPDSADFDAGFWTESFRLARFGAVPLNKIKEPFAHQPWRDKRSIIMGPANPNFVKLDDISMYVKDAVVTSEDGSFPWHKGFNMRAMRRSIAENIRKGHFARGGSTITMQLVKNVFLRPEKTIARKLEEALLVWLIENQYLVSKDRMLEVYLNAIEWGPNVYGIEEAGRFYFERHPAQLYLPQSIFLAMIVPSPRKYMYNFEPAPDSLRTRGLEFTLRPAFQQYFKLVGGIMLAQEKITQEQFDALDYREIQLQGESLRLMRKTLRDKQPEETKAVEEMEDELDDLDLQ